MLGRLRSHVSFANTMSLIAVFVAMGGTGYAAIKIPKKSVGSAQLKNNAVSSSKVKNGALRAIDFRPGDLPAGATGPAGAKGDKGDKGDPGTNGTAGAPGADGTADAYARVQADGTLELGAPPPLAAPQHKGVDQADIQKAGTGIYCFGGLDMTVAAALVSMDNAGAVATTTEVISVAIQRGNNLGSCDAAHQQARVVITDVNNDVAANPAAVDGRFNIWFIEG
jgi:hypothetical protein